MIRTHVDAVVQVRDGFTGWPIESGGLLCTLDGLPCRPVRKPGGGLVLVNLPGGSHRLLLNYRGFREEQVDFSVDGGAARELYVALKPSAGYAFRGEVARLWLIVREGASPAVDRALWLTSPGAPECKLAQTKAEPGATELRIFRKGLPTRLPIPGPFLVDDGEHTEIVTLQSLNGETGRLAAPLQREHGRGSLLLPVQQYRTDGEGELSAVFRGPGGIVLFGGKGEPLKIALAPGETRQTLSL